MDNTLRNDSSRTCAIFIELYVKSISYNVSLFSTVLEFTVKRDEGDFAELRLNGSILLLNDGSDLEFDHPFRGRLNPNYNGIGTEIGIAVSDLSNTYRRASIFEGLKVSELKRQDWGLRDFRVITPDNYYLRITEPPN